MYDPTVQRALLQVLGRWQRLTEEDLLRMLEPAERLRYRPEALRDLLDEGLITVSPSGDAPVITLTPEGESWVLSGRGEEGQQRG